MNKNLRRLLSCGTAFALCAGIFTSCNDDDDYETRISVLETAVGDLKTQLGKALTSGASVTGVVQNDNGTYTITLSDGQTIQTGGASGAGSDVKVTVTDTSAIINVNGEEYTLPLGAPVSSLKYAPEYLDGMVEIADGKGAQVNFLVRPEIASLDGATFTVAESHELKARVIGEETFKVASAALENGLVKLTLLCLDSDARGSHHAVSVQMNYRGAVIGSDYFTVHVSDDFSFVSEAIDENIKVTAPGATLNPESKAWTFNVNGGDFGQGFDFATVFTGIPAGAKFRVASVSKQPGGPAQEKQAILAASLAEDGKFAFTKRPGSAFNDNAEQPGFLVEIINSELAVIAKTYVTITDELADANFNVFTSDLEAEWGGREKCVPLGASTIDLQAAFKNYETEFPIIHNGAEGVFQKWSEVAVEVPAGSVMINKGGRLVLDALGQKYAPEATCHGIYWFNRGLSIRLPENLAPYTDANGKEWTSGGEGYGKEYFQNGDDMWMGQYN
ncbi:MAG: DUF4988 domain-containing protein, partial [Duncaniella sp.]|nr:DUF4988 domain-containing protein [Duncaniella sp.]